MRDTRHDGRREFLKKAALASAGGIAGGVAVNFASPYVLPETMKFEWNRSYWAQALPAKLPGLDRDLTADIAVIGGGFTGLSAAYYTKISAPQKKVVVLEAQRCGNGASGRNGAMLLTSTEERYMEWSGDPEMDKRIYELTVENIARLRELERTTGVDAEIEQNGALQVCNTEELAEKARQYLERAGKEGLPFEFWNRERVRQAIGTRAYPGASYEPNSGQVHPGKLVGLLQAAAKSAGVEIFEGTPIVHAEEGETIRLTTANGKTIRSGAIVLATNAFTSKLGYLRRAVAPFFSYVAMTEPLSPEKLAEIGWRERIPFNDMRTLVYYLGLTKDNRVHIGGGSSAYAFNDGVEEPPGAERHFALLREELAKIYPALAEAPFAFTWSGCVDMSLDQSPAVGRMGRDGNVLYALGYSGHGVNLTSVFGRVLADLLNGKEGGWSWLPYLNRLPAYLPNEPFRWAALQLGMAYYTWMDPKKP